MPGRFAPANHTPLVALTAVSLDLETTGLDIRQDRIIQIGAVSLDGSELLDHPRIDRLINPGMPIPPEAARITGIDDTKVAGQDTLAAAIGELRDCLHGRVVIGHHIAFDLGILRHEAARLGEEWHDPAALDIGQIFGALEPSIPDLGLETIAARFGIEITGRHTAIGDALAVAEVYGQLIQRLRDNDVRTLGEASAFAARRQDIVRREAEAGWHADRRAADSTTGVRIDSYVFSRAVGDVMSPSPMFISADDSLQVAATQMVSNRIGALLVGEAERPPDGILTERDILRALAETRDSASSRPVSSAMSVPVACISGDELLYRALARMDALGVRHLCVTDERNRAVGMVSQRDLLHHRARAESVVDEMVSDSPDSASLALAFSRVATVAEGLVAEGVGGRETARVVSRELRAVTARAAEIALARMTGSSHGPAPAPWCLLVLGSGGRGESLLSADQDNALIHGGSDEDDPWFAAFGENVADILHEAGVPYCNGGVMASQEAWRGTETGWRNRIEHWLERAKPEDLLNVDIFFDLRPVAGDTALGSALLDEAVAGAARSRTFLALLAQ
jgi:CBS domain-containing protein